MSKAVTLTPCDILSAVITGSRRLVDSMMKDLNKSYGSDRNWDQDIEGALAEMAFAKEYGLWFDHGVGRYKSKDVGEFHIRHTKHDNGSLILRGNDPEGIYVLVTGSLGVYTIRGWIHSLEAQQDKYLKAPNGRPPAWFVPHHELNNIDTLHKEARF